jgi:hypothetical protein
MLIAQYLNNAIFTAIKPPNTSPEFIEVIQSIRIAFEPVLRDLKSNQSLSVLDALISESHFPSPYNRLKLDVTIEVQCGDIGYFTGSIDKPQFVGLESALASKAFRSLALTNLESAEIVDLKPKDVWSVTKDEEHDRCGPL